MGVEEEGKAWGKLVHVQTPLDASLHVLEAIGQSESQFLDGCRPGLADVVAGDADGVPPGQVLGAELEGVHDKAHGGSGGEEPRFLGDVFLEDVILDGATQLFHRDAPLLSGHDVHGPDHCCRAVDSHGGGDLVNGDAVEEDLHVGQRRHGHPALAKLALGFGSIGVVAVKGGEIEGYRETGLTVLQQVLVTGVGLFGCAKAGEHAHGPQAATVHGRVDAPGERILAGKAQVALIVEIGDVGRGVKTFHRRA